MERSSNRTVTPACIAALIVTGVAPLLGGSVRLWAEATIAISVGLIFLMFPPRKTLPRALSFGFIGLFALAIAAFLPARWFPTPGWRRGLLNLGLQLPGTVSAQPWLTVEGCLLFLLCLSWAYYLWSADWTLPERRFSWLLIGSAISVLGGLLITAYVLRHRIPFWPVTPEFGFFPNRNHTSNVLGLGGILVYALALRGFDEEERTWWLWLVALSVICSALVINYSRAGIILLFGGILAWHLYWLTSSAEKRRPFIASIGIALLLALVIWSGAKTAMRFASEETTRFFSVSENGRVLIYRDAIDLSLKSPVTGIGLNNFGAVFATTQRFSVAEDIAVHPESDWLWSAVELGWLAPVLIALLFAAWARNCFPFARGTLRLMRGAAFIAVCGFALHAMLDVPGHQIGALWPALFLASTALSPNVAQHRSSLGLVGFRILGLILIVVGLWWFGSLAGLHLLPTTATLRRTVRDIASAYAKGDYQRMLTSASKALEIAPLNWELYYQRGLAAAASYHPRAETQRDFAAARYLLPNWPDLYLKEGSVCLSVDQADLAFDIWKEGLNRLRNPVALYSDIYGFVKDDAELRERWRKLGQDNIGCVLVFLQNATPTEFQIELSWIIGENAELHAFTPPQMGRLFELWYQKGEKLSLAETLQAHPEWREIGWRELARVYSDYQDYRQGYEILVRYAGVQLPEVSPNEALDSLARRFRASGNENDGLMLTRAEAASGQIDDALAVITILTSRPHPSPLVSYVEAELWAKKQNWAKASQAMWKYVEQAKR